MSHPIELSGRQFGHLVVVAFSHKDARRIRHWYCKCTCGTEVVVAGNNLGSGNSKSCGCGHGLPVDCPITHEQLCALVKYDLETGLFYWLVNGRNFKAGDQAGHYNPANGYVRIAFKKDSYYAHQLAVFYVTGEWPKEEVDHDDLDGQNNSWENLRPATHTENCWNSSPRSHNSTGYKGVHKRKRDFVARITANGKIKHIGSFSDPIEAAHAYDAQAIKLHGQFARINFEKV